MKKIYPRCTHEKRVGKTTKKSKKKQFVEDDVKCPKCGSIDVLYHFDEMFKLHGKCVSCDHVFPADDEE